MPNRSIHSRQTIRTFGRFTRLLENETAVMEPQMSSLAMVALLGDFSLPPSFFLCFSEQTNRVVNTEHVLDPGRSSSRSGDEKETWNISWRRQTVHLCRLWEEVQAHFGFPNTRKNTWETSSPLKMCMEKASGNTNEHTRETSVTTVTCVKKALEINQPWCDINEFTQETNL